MVSKKDLLQLKGGGMNVKILFWEFLAGMVVAIWFGAMIGTYASFENNLSVIPAWMVSSAFAFLCFLLSLAGRISSALGLALGLGTGLYLGLLLGFPKEAASIGITYMLFGLVGTFVGWKEIRSIVREVAQHAPLESIWKKQ